MSSMTAHSRPSGQYLKRSASTASLPTPPRTQKKKKRRAYRLNDLDAPSDISGEESEERRTAGGGLDSTASEGSGDELPVDSPDAPSIQRRTDEEEQDAFWIGKAAKKQSQSRASTQPLSPIVEDGVGYTNANDDDDADVTHLIERRKRRLSSNSSVGEGGLASPPPSHRKVAGTSRVKLFTETQAASATARQTTPTPTPSVLRTPSRPTKTVPQLDYSPNNPFLESPQSPSGNSGAADSDAYDSDDDTGPIEDLDYEPPTITYLHRGHKRVYPNPAYNPQTKRPFSPPPNSRLPPDHPDYEPDLRCPPKILFPSKKLRKEIRSRGGMERFRERARAAANAAASLSSEEDSKKLKKDSSDQSDANGWDSSDDDLPSYEPQMPQFGNMPPKAPSKTRVRSNGAPPQAPGAPGGVIPFNAAVVRPKPHLKLDLMTAHLNRQPVNSDPRTAEDSIGRLEVSEEELLRAPGLKHKLG